jgi:hypothetical protein
MNEYMPAPQPATQSHKQPPSKPPRIALNLDDDNDDESGGLIVFECVAICDPEELAKIAPPRQP